MNPAIASVSLPAKNQNDLDPKENAIFNFYNTIIVFPCRTVDNNIDIS